MKTRIRNQWPGGLSRAATCATVLVSAALVAQPVAAQQALPNGPLKFVHPFPAGSGSDVAYRPVMEKLGAMIGRTVLTEPRPGGNSAVASQYVRSQPPDGSTFYQLSTTAIVRSVARPDIDIRKDFTPIACITNAPLVLAVSDQVKARNLKELVDEARARPGEINYGSYGFGSGAHLIFEYLAHEAGVKMTHVPYQGSAQAVQDTVAGRVQVTGAIVATLRPHVKELGGSGRLRMLAVSTLEPSAIVPGVPGLKAAGFPATDWGLWAGIVGPAGMPRGVVDTLSRAFTEVYKDRSTIETIAKFGQDPLYCSPDELGRRIAKDFDTFTKLVRDTGIKLE